MQCTSNKRGLDVALQEKLRKKFDPKKAENCLKWIKEVTGKDTTGDFHEDLKDGFLLCMLLKKVAPDVYKKKGFKSKHTTQPFKARTQIQNFIAGCKELGMKETDVCTSQDLYEGDNLNNVVNHLYALNALAHDTKFKGPFLEGAHTKFAKGNKRNFTPEQLAKGKTMIPLHNQGGIAHEEKNNFDSYGIVKSTAKASSVIPKMAQGGAKVEDSNFDSYGIVKSQAKASSAIPKMAQGGAKVETDNFDSYGIVKVKK